METPIALVMPLVRIKLKCPDLDSFVDKYQADVSSVGIFVRTRSPLAAGTSIRFDFRLADDSCLFRGNGVVVWSRRDETLAPLLEAGMMVAFDELTDGTRATFDRVLARARSLAEAAETAPTLVRALEPPGRPLPMTTKMGAAEVEELRARMREGLAAEAAAEPVAPPAPVAAPAPPKPVVVEVDLDSLTRGDVTARVDWSHARPAARGGGRMLAIGVLGSMLLVAYYLFFVHGDLAARMLQWLGAS